MGCRAEIRDRACLTGLQQADALPTELLYAVPFRAAPHPNELQSACLLFGANDGQNYHLVGTVTATSSEAGSGREVSRKRVQVIAGSPVDTVKKETAGITVAGTSATARWTKSAET
jgi:hypothetical protein